MSAPRILLVEDDATVAAEVCRHFGEMGLSVEHKSNGAEGLRAAMEQDFDLVLLDVVLPEKNGFDICRELRSAKPLLPILMLTTRTSEVDTVLGFELGADDYIAKPFRTSELLARVRGRLRRSDVERKEVERRTEDSQRLAASAGITIGELQLDLERCALTKRGQPIQLTAKEFDVLSFLMSNPGRVFSKGDLLDAVWGTQALGYEDAVVSLVRRLRVKIEDNPSNPSYLLNMRGLGYSFVTPDAVAPRSEL